MGTTRATWAAACVVLAISVSGCASIPSGPAVMVLPGYGKTFEQFQQDDGICRQWSAQQIGITPDQALGRSTVGGAVIGTVTGAAAGAAIGAAFGNPAAGAAIGAGAGGLGGTAVGSSWGAGAQISVQQRYDITYMQCMYTKGNQIPVPRGSQTGYASSSMAAPPGPPPNVPPPPPGNPPPPPPAPR